MEVEVRACLGAMQSLIFYHVEIYRVMGREGSGIVRAFQGWRWCIGNSVSQRVLCG